MLNTIDHLTSSTVSATDGDIGEVTAAFFDDQAWVIRYLVVDTGGWLSGRRVLLSPYSVSEPLGHLGSLDVSLTRQQVKDSPDIDTHQPVSRQHERALLGYYEYPDYWEGGGMWAGSGTPARPAILQGEVREALDKVLHERDVRAGDVHLRDSTKVTGYDIRATDESIGHVHDFVFDDESWAIRYLIVDTRNWWPGGQKVLVATQWIDRIDWDTKSVYVTLTRDQVKRSPMYHEDAAILRDDEQRLHDVVGRPGYWAAAEAVAKSGREVAAEADTVPGHTSGPMFLPRTVAAPSAPTGPAIDKLPRD
jgi:uncharacterized protein YrrD